jgi:hypothetical protein
MIAVGEKGYGRGDDEGIDNPQLETEVVVQS